MAGLPPLLVVYHLLNIENYENQRNINLKLRVHNNYISFSRKQGQQGRIQREGGPFLSRGGQHPMKPETLLEVMDFTNLKIYIVYTFNCGAPLQIFPAL